MIGRDDSVTAFAWARSPKGGYTHEALPPGCVRHAFGGPSRGRGGSLAEPLQVAPGRRGFLPGAKLAKHLLAGDVPTGGGVF